MDANDKKIGYIYEGLEKLTSLNFGISEKLKKRLNQLTTDLASIQQFLEDRQNLLDLWDEVINLIPIIATNPNNLAQLPPSSSQFGGSR